MMEEPQDREITLSVGRMFGLFFGLVLLCGMFFVIGYSLGRSAQRAEGSIIPDLTSSPGGSKPVPSQPQAKPSESAATNAPSGAGAQDMTFYHAVQQPAPDTHLPGGGGESATQTPPATSPGPTSSVIFGYRVQVAAVSRQEDATALRDALQRKGYPAVIASAPGDALFHVQVGPFADIKDAEQARSRLIADGYNPILKR